MRCWTRKQRGLIAQGAGRGRVPGGTPVAAPTADLAAQGCLKPSFNGVEAVLQHVAPSAEEGVFVL